LEGGEFVSCGYCCLRRTAPSSRCERESVSATPTCPSCGAQRLGPYCAECGEKFISPKDFELKQFLFEQLPDEFLHVDGKLPRTMRLLFTQPGVLAKNYVAGRRQPFVGSLRVYLVLFLLQVVVGAVVSGPGVPLLERAHDFDLFGVLSHIMSSRPDVDWRDPALVARIRERGHWLSELATLLIFMLVAGVQKLVFYRLHRRYLEHVALALNVASFFLAALIVCELLVWAVTRNWSGYVEAQLQSLVAMSALPVYWFLAIRRFYEIKALPSAAAAIVITVANAVIALALSTVVYAILIATA
jgi:Protein of unknown function (DUF3667)